MTIEQEFSKLNSKMQQLKFIAILVLITPFLGLNIYWKGDVPPFAIFLSVIFPAVSLIFINNAIDKRHEYIKEILSNEILTQSIIEQGFYDKNQIILIKKAALQTKNISEIGGKMKKAPHFTKMTVYSPQKNQLSYLFLMKYIKI